MHFERRSRVILAGHSYLRRLGEYMENNRCRDLMLLNAHVTVLGYGGATVAYLHRQLLSDMIVNADVIFLHIGENDYERRQPVVTARAIVDLAMDLIHVHGARYIVIGELVRFSVHQSDWCIRVNTCLRQLVTRLRLPNIRLWRQRRALYNPRSLLFNQDGVHVDRRRMQVYLNTVRHGVLSVLRHQR